MAVIDDISRPVRHPRQVVATPERADLLSSRLPLPVVLYLFCVVIPIGFQAGPLTMTTLRLFLIVMILPLMVQLLMGRFGRVFLTDILFALHVVWTAVALFVNNPDQVVQQIGSVGVEFLGGYMIGRAYIRTPEAFAALCRAMVLIVLCTVPFALYETLTGRPLIIEYLRKLNLAGVGIVTIEPRMGLERVQAVFAHPIHYGLFCSVAFSLAFVALKDMTSVAWRYTTSVAVVLAGFLALSSGALTAIAIQIALIIWVSIFAGYRNRWWLLVGLFALAYVVVDLMSNRTPLKVFMTYATFSAHNAYWRSIIFEWGMKNVWANPLFGIGLNDWVRPHYMNSGSMDNFWLVMAVRYGIPGFLLLTIGYVISTAKVMRRNFDTDMRLTLFRRAWVFSVLGLSFTLCTVHVWTNLYSFVFFFFGAGIWLITAEPAAGPPPAGPGRRTGGRLLRRPDAVPDASPSLPPSGPGNTPDGPRYSRFPAR